MNTVFIDERFLDETEACYYWKNAFLEEYPNGLHFDPNDVEMVAGLIREGFGPATHWLYEKVELPPMNLHGANLTEANLTRADLTNADLSGADLRWANLHGADLHGANLAGANLRWANLTMTNLTEAKLTRAKLTGADLTEADGPFTIGSFGRHQAIAAGGYIAIGCERHDYDHWLQNYEAIGLYHDYSLDEIADYGAWIKLAVARQRRIEATD